MMNKLQEFYAYARESEPIIDTKKAAIYFKKAVELAREDMSTDAGNEKLYSNALMQIFLTPEQGSLEFVCYCAHILKLASLMDELEEFKSSSISLREHQAVDAIMSSYSDDWEDLDLF